MAIKIIPAEASTSPLADAHGRTFPYLRLSLTDVCNFRCTYCLPNGYQKTGREKDILTPAEIGRLTRAFADMGTWKVRLTGGEPTLRPDFLQAAEAVANTPGIRLVALTTNGYRLSRRAGDFYRAGLRAVNISIDSLDSEKFHRITGHDRLNEVLAGLDACLEAGFDKVKTNTVLMRGINDIELEEFLLLARTRPVEVRFIELMRTGDMAELFRRRHLSPAGLREKLAAGGWVEELRGEGAGPAVTYMHPDYRGKIGFIAPYSRNFCAGCNRLRVSCRGELQLCLFGSGRESLRPLLQKDGQGEELQTTVRELLSGKAGTHRLHENNPGITENLSAIGG